MNRKFDIYIDIKDGLGYQLITNHKAVKKVEPANITRDEDNMYTRVKMGEITFQNVAGYNIYDIIENVSFETEINIKIIYGSLELEGYFAKIDCKFDADKNGRIIKAKPAIIDQYRRFLENYEKEIDVTENDWTYESSTAEVISNNIALLAVWSKNGTGHPYGKKEIKDDEWSDLNTSGVTDFIGFFNSDNSPKISLLSTTPYNAQDGDGLDLQALIDVMKSRNQGWELCEVTIWRGSSWWQPFTIKRLFYVTCKFAREFAFVPTSDGTQTGDKVEPTGDGWIASNDEPVSSERRIGSVSGVRGYYFSRLPYNGAYKNDFWELQPAEVNRGSGGASFYWTDKRTTKINYPVSVDESGNEEDASFELNTLIDFKSLLTYMYQQLHPDLATKEVKSLFFWNDNEADFAFMAGLSGANYVTREPNELNNLKCMHTYVLKTDEDEGETDDSNLLLSFKKVLDDLKKLFPVKEYVDSENNLWIEHVKFFEYDKIPFDISARKELELTHEYEFDTSKLFEEKVFSQINAGYVDFTKNKLTFAQAVSNNRNKDLVIEETTEIFTTDLKYCLENPNSLENGLILLLANNGVVNEQGFISENEQTNGALSLSALLNKYWTYEGVWTEGKINGNNVNFDFALRSKVGNELQFRGIKNSLFYKTQIGVGLIDNGNLDLENETTKIKLRYRYSSGSIGDQQYLAYGDDEGDIYNFGNTGE